MSGHHIVPVRVYLGIFAALCILTVITVAAAQFDFGPLNNLVALGIAGPELVDDSLRPDHPVGVDNQQGQKRSLLARTEIDRFGVIGQL